MSKIIKSRIFEKLEYRKISKLENREILKFQIFEKLEFRKIAKF
jgi:hypothetical protein